MPPRARGTARGGDPSRRPLKRQRVSRQPIQVSAAISALLERLAVVQIVATEIRDDHQSLIDDYDRRAMAKRAAAKASLKPPRKLNEPAAARFMKGDDGSTEVRRSRRSRNTVSEQGPFPISTSTRTSHAQLPPKTGNSSGPPAAMSLLVEPESAEKTTVEQSVIWRAHMINRRNAELARERLPKQPEAQRGKCHWDYLLDEALWLANDFREETKWKMQMARKVSKMVAQYHALQEQRRVRKRREEELRMVRIANGIARDVKKFWGQIREVAEYRESVVRDARLAEERREQLSNLLEQTEAYTSVLASKLKPHAREGDTPRSEVQPRLEVRSNLNADNDGTKSSQIQDKLTSEHGTATRKRKRVEFEVGAATHLRDANDDSTGGDPGELSQSDKHCNDSGNDKSLTFRQDHDDGNDDEATLSADEAKEEKDPDELNRLANDADLSVEELLRQQGIDPSAYARDNRTYAESSSETDSSCESDDRLSSNGDTEDSARPSEDLVASGRACSTLSTQQTAKSSDRPQCTEEVTNNGSSMLAVQVDNRLCARSASAGQSARGVALDTVPADATNAAVKGGENAEVSLSGPSHTRGPLQEATTRSNTSTQPTVVARPDPTQDTVSRDSSKGGLPRELTDKLQRQPATGETVSVPQVLLRGRLRGYQKEGLDWLVALYKQGLNGILADEMGLGKTFQTIALLAWLAVEHGIWGPHLIVVPTSVMINWEVEFKKFLPGFKVLSYFGSLKERRAKRQGWSRPNTFHVCITSYALVVQDAVALRRKKWVYLILDEAHNIKNFQSQRWQTLLSFPSQRRLLLTGTPLQNSVMELWSLMHFLMPDVFRSHVEFKDWFSKPLNEIVELSSGTTGADSTGVVANLHRVLRPFLLRRLKSDVEKGLPMKTEHVITCQLSKRQRQLYEDFMSRGDIRETLAGGDFIGVMSVLMQLRKVCNHPDLFEGRRIISPFAVRTIFFPVPKLAACALESNRDQTVDVGLLGLNFASIELEPWGGWWCNERVQALSVQKAVMADAEVIYSDGVNVLRNGSDANKNNASFVSACRLAESSRLSLKRNGILSALRCRRRGVYGSDLIAAVTMTPSTLLSSLNAEKRGKWDEYCLLTVRSVRSYEDVAARAHTASESFTICTRPAIACPVDMRYAGDDSSKLMNTSLAGKLRSATGYTRALFRSYGVRSLVSLPDARLVQWDCGKLQVLDPLLRQLKSAGHRVLVFAQMTRVLDVLESFLNLHAHRYLRLDGSTKADDRQRLVERFNTDHRVFCMILTTRSGGIGLNLTGADTVIFYDTDYNPSIDAQAQDRVHRIGQTKPVHIYRLVSEQTVEENILKRAQQKRTLESLVISGAGFTTDAFRSRLDVMELVQPSKSSATKNTGVKDSSNIRLVESDVRQEGADVMVRQVEASDNAGGGERRFWQPDEVSKLRGNGATRPEGSNVVADPLPGVGGAGSDFLADGALAEYDPGRTDVDTALLMADDEREELANAQRKREAENARAEFIDSEDLGSGVLTQPGSHCFLVDTGEDVLDTLSPVQRYVLRLIESQERQDSIEENETVDSGEYRRRSSVSFANLSGAGYERESVEKLGTSGMTELGDGNWRSSEDPHPDGEMIDSDDTPVVYELELMQEAHASRLKALTDIDADIKLYLPLRDDDPEELKVSAVVSGTAAAGLECAEDAAFFPHAYNRMSRTPYATRRQKEKAAANLAKRLAEEKAMALEREKERILAANQTRNVSAETSADKARSRSKPKPCVVQKANVSVAHIKPVRTETVMRARSQSLGVTQNGTGSTAVPEVASGLFPKNLKKPKNRGGGPYQGRTGIASNVTYTKEDIGDNDRWTSVEEQRMLDLSVMFSKNLSLVSDGLLMDPRVAAGQRVARGYLRCVDRMRAIAKDSKTPATLLRASIKDIENMQKHSKALTVASGLVKSRPNTWVRGNEAGTGKMHASHENVMREAAEKQASFVASVPPTMATVSSLVSAPSYHRPGMKAAECTPAAQTKRRRPFTRPRFMHERTQASLSAGPQPADVSRLQQDGTTPNGPTQDGSTTRNPNLPPGVASGVPPSPEQSRGAQAATPYTHPTACLPQGSTLSVANSGRNASRSQRTSQNRHKVEGPARPPATAMGAPGGSGNKRRAPAHSGGPVQTAATPSGLLPRTMVSPFVKTANQRQNAAGYAPVRREAALGPGVPPCAPGSNRVHQVPGVVGARAQSAAGSNASQDTVPRNARQPGAENMRREKAAVQRQSAGAPKGHSMVPK